MLFNLLKGMVSNSAKNDTRYYLQAVHITPDVIEANNGYSGIRMFVKNWGDHIVNIEPDTNVLLCRHSLNNVLKMFNAKQTLTFVVSNQGASLNGVNIELVDRRYPDTNRVFPKKLEFATCETGIDIKLLADLCKAVDLCLDKLKLKGVRFAAQAHGKPYVFTKELDSGNKLEALLMPVCL